MVIKINLAYNTIIRRPLLHDINITINTKCLTLKFPTKDNVVTISGNQLIFYKYIFSCLKMKKTIMFNNQKGLTLNRRESSTKFIRELQDMVLKEEYLDSLMKIGSTLMVE